MLLLDGRNKKWYNFNSLNNWRLEKLKHIVCFTLIVIHCILLSLHHPFQSHIDCVIRKFYDINTKSSIINYYHVRIFNTMHVNHKKLSFSYTTFDRENSILYINRFKLYNSDCTQLYIICRRKRK